jgi:hypothetical protein
MDGHLDLLLLELGAEQLRLQLGGRHGGADGGGWCAGVEPWRRDEGKTLEAEPESSETGLDCDGRRKKRLRRLTGWGFCPVVFDGSRLGRDHDRWAIGRDPVLERIWPISSAHLRV